MNVKSPNKTANMSYNMNDLITDRIGKDFFQNVLGKTTTNYQTTAYLTNNQFNANANTPLRKVSAKFSDGPIRTMHSRQVRQEVDSNRLNFRSAEGIGHLETTYWDDEANLAFKETILTSDQSTLITNDEGDEETFTVPNKLKRRSSSGSFITAQSNNMNDYMELLDNEEKENEDSATITNESTVVTRQSQSVLTANNQSKKRNATLTYTLKLVNWHFTLK